jgi:hypothetical protein
MPAMIGAANGVPPASAHRIGAPVQDACADGATEEITADHVIGATGYRVDLGSSEHCRSLLGPQHKGAGALLWERSKLAPRMKRINTDTKRLHG